MTTLNSRRAGVGAGQAPAHQVPTLARATFELPAGPWRWSPEMYALLRVADDGGDPAELVFDRMHPADRARVLALLEVVVATPGPFAGQYRLRSDDGAERAVAFLGDVVRAEDGEPLRLEGMAFDVTDAVRLAASEAVRAATSERAAVEQVKGALMHAHGLDADAAFAVLVQLSQQANVRVAVLAARVVELFAAPAVAGARPPVLELLEAAAGGRAGEAPRAET
ncbi:PAS and ANTAR domain-containing protein [Phycicoccus avicenniae]|uniref:PAS and ANTAR domain-containing protein n=1 Tax=Phycicoccus avicenniae TaxID=2828860 RepID=UPI003D28B609